MGGPADDMKQIDGVLDEYERSIGLPAFNEKYGDDLSKYFTMSREQLEALTIEDCAEIGVILSGLAFHVQRCYNREIARVNWADSKLKQLVAGREQQYRGSWDSQFYQAAKEDGYTTKLLAIKQYARQRADRLYFLSTSIQNKVQLFVNLQKAKGMKS